jgi:hypothetical protein
MPSNVQAASGAIPVFPGGLPWLNITADLNTQIKSGAGVLSRLVVNTVGTASTVAFYDGLSSVVTLTLASPGVVNWPAHGLAAGAAVEFTTTSALPTGLTAGTIVYVSITSLLAGSFKVADTKAHALAGTNTINFTGSQSGVQTGWNVSNLIGTFSTTAQDSVDIGAATSLGLIAITASSGSANLTVLYN